MAACTSGSPAMASAGLSLCLLLHATFALSSSITSQTSAPLAPPEKPIRQVPFFPSQQELESLNVAPAVYDLALLNDDDLSAFEEETAIENEPKRPKLKNEIPSNIYEDINSNDVDFPNYYDSEKSKKNNLNSNSPDSNYDIKIDPNINTLSNDPIISYKHEKNIGSQNLKGNQIEIDSKNALPMYDIDREDNEIDLNNQNPTDYGHSDKYLSKVDRREPNRNEKYDRENNNVSKYNDFESLNEDYAQRDDDFEVRKKRESESTLNKTKPRAVTGDTVLNIAGAVRDRIGELAPFASPPSLAPPPGMPPSAPSGATRLDTVVIRSAASVAPPPEQTPKESDDQSNEVEEEGVVTAEVGARVALKCDAPGGVGGNFTWTRDNEVVPGTEVDSSGTLLLRATRAAAGVWRCERTQGVGEGTTLRIYEPAGLAWLRVEGRRLDLGRAWLPAREGSSLPIACHADGGVPPPVLVWRVNPASHLLTFNRTTYRDGVATSWASVLATRVLHNATITCEALQRTPTYTLRGEGDAEREGGKRVASVMLQVTYPPTFSISRRPGFGRPLVAGAGAALRCDVSANPLPHVSWTRQDEPLPQPLLTSGVGWAEARWVSLSRSHAGWYRCVCSWGGTTYSSIGYFLMLVPEAESDASLSDPQRCSSGKGACRRPAASEPRAAGSRPDSFFVQSGAARARAVSIPSEVLSEVAAEGSGRGVAWRRVSCSVCGRNVRARWVHGGTSVNAQLVTPPTPATNISPSPSHSTCRIATYYGPGNEEIWCVAVNEAGGDVAVFPPLPPLESRPHPASPRAASQGTSLFASAAILVLLSGPTLYFDWMMTPI